MHLSRIEEALGRIKAAGLKLKPQKCKILQTEVVFLGHMVSAAGIKPSPTNISKILDWPRPKTPRQVKQIVAMGSYYRRYVRDYASIVRPMVELTKKGKRFIWSKTCQHSFESIKKALVSANVMGYPLNEAGEFVLDVDASDIGIGGILHQVQDGRERVIAYASRALNKAEKNYCITEKELLAVRYFIEYFRQYLLGSRFLVRSDHQALVWIFSLKEPRGKLARWLEVLSLYDFSIEYRPGRKQGHCDALPRCENPKDCECPEQDTSEPLKCGPCLKCTKRAMEMMHKSVYNEMVDSSSTLPKTATVESVDLQDGINSKEHSDNQNIIIQMTRMVNEVSEPKPGPSNKVQQCNPSGQKHSTFAITWAGDKSIEDFKHLQSSDPDIGPIFQAKFNNKRPSSREMVSTSPACRYYWILWDSLQFERGLLSKKFMKKDGSGEYLQFLVPRVMKPEMHNSALSGHLGCKKTKEKTIQRFYWYALKDDIYLHIRKCDICAKDKNPVKPPKAPLGSLSATPHESTNLTPNLLTMGREVRLPAELVFGSTISDQEGEITTYGDYVDVLRDRMQHAHQVARKDLSSTAKRNKNSMTQRLHSTDTHREKLYGALMSQGRWESCQNCNQPTVDHSW